MKKIISAVIAAAVLICAFSGCNKKDSENISVYFCDKQNNTLSEETRSVDKKLPVKDKVRAALTFMIEGPHNEKNVPVISKKAKLLSVNTAGSVATVDFSKEYSEKEGAAALLLRFAVVNTVCSVSGIDGTVIKVEGQPLRSESTDKEIGVLSLSDIAMETNDQTTDKTTISLYFPLKDGSGLSCETRTIAPQNTLSPEKTIINELIKGPKSSEFTRSLSEDVRLINIETKDGVCYVNFSGEFVTKTQPGTNSTTLTLYSVVNSLCQLKNVNSVSFFVNGENGVEFGNFVLDIPYEKNVDIVK